MYGYQLLGNYIGNRFRSFIYSILDRFLFPEIEEFEALIDSDVNDSDHLKIICNSNSYFIYCVITACLLTTHVFKTCF